MKFSLQADLKLGVTTSSTQIEGNERGSWYEWYTYNKIADESDPFVATEHYKRFEEDFKIFKDMKLQAYKMSVSWAKLEPSRGQFDKKVLEHYRKEIQQYVDIGVPVTLVLHHFTEPVWFSSKFGFAGADSVSAFVEYAVYVAENLGDLVNTFITFNEPNTYVENGYIKGIWPIGKSSKKLAKTALINIIASHVIAYKKLHEIREQRKLGNTLVSFSCAYRQYSSKEKLSIFNSICTNIKKARFQTNLSIALARGMKINRYGIKKGRYYDFIGMNYFTRDTVSNFKDGVYEFGKYGDDGQEIFPDGIVNIAKALYNKYKAPLYITNGIADSKDSKRPQFIYDHLKKLCESGLPIAAYYYYSFTDGFEWLDGIAKKYGLVEIDFGSQKRRIRESGKFFTEIIENGGVTEEMFDRMRLSE